MSSHFFQNLFCPYTWFKVYSVCMTVMYERYDNCKPFTLQYRRFNVRKQNDNKYGLVYSTNRSEKCPACGKYPGNCSCHATAASSKNSGGIRVGRETKGRKGKGVTVITGVPLPREELSVLAKQLKQKCGAGGTVKDGVIEIQGDHRDVVITELQKHGYTAKRSGG